MFIKPVDYEELLSEYSHSIGVIALLKQYRAYLEMIPSMRRSDESLITIPLPVIRVRQTVSTADYGGIGGGMREVTPLPCDVAVLMCDPEWKVKTGVEILIFIHRPDEDFSSLLGRWRRTQILLNKGYEWLMPLRYKHILNEAAEDMYPLFVVLPQTPERIIKGLKGACLPFVLQTPASVKDCEGGENLTSSEDSGVSQ
ncbi:MAG: hypothetical protein F6K19_24975 [Cyanothece sp. SIO1E1]|nr:hypothetical protein [Cyanothece sp. SIO1E1]